MGFPAAHPRERRTEVERMLRETDLTMVEIGVRAGISRHTVQTWNARSGWPRPPRPMQRIAAARWPAARRAAIGRLCGAPAVDPADVAEAVGLGRAAGDALSLACGPAGPPGAGAPEAARRPSIALDATGVADAPTLRAHLRAHIARQIAAFDAALLGEGAAVLDSARVLRDLGGLKRLFDEVCAGAEPAGGEAGDGGRPEPDFPALRAQIARRLARFLDREAPA